jgi:sensor domain CHASE-containing protein
MVKIDVANNLFTIILSLLGIISVFVGFVAWFIRLESKVQYLQKDHEENKQVIYAKLDTMQVTLNQLLQAIGRLEGGQRRD